MTKRNAKIITEYALIFLMAIVSAGVYHLFVVKNNFAPAGLNGIATMIQYKTGFSIGYMSLIMNIPLCVLAFFLVNRRFAVRSMFYCLVYSLAYLILQNFDLTAIQYDAHGHDTIYPVILSGVLSGAVHGICFKNNASTGGTDILSKYISKVRPELNFFYVTFFFNAVVAVISLFVYAEPDEASRILFNYKPACLCILYCFISTFVGNQIIAGTQRAYKFTVITTHPEEITEEIFRVLRHGSTQVEAVGSYNNEEKTILLCVVNCHQLADFKNILEKYDNTFSYCETVNETYGNFKRIK